MIVAIAATSTMSKAGLAMSDRWRQSSDGVDLDQPFWLPRNDRFCSNIIDFDP
jgi:hypothetical protein